MGPRKIDEIMEKLEIIVDEMMADDGPVPMELGNVGTHDTKTTQNDSDTSNDMSYADVCAIAWKGYKAGKGAGKKGSSGSGAWHRGKGADEWPSGKRDERASREANPMGTVTRTKGAREKARARGKGKSETRYCYVCGEQGHIQVVKMIKHHRGRVSLKEKELASLETHDEEGEWCRWRRRIYSRPAVHYLAEEDEDEQVSVFRLVCNPLICVATFLPDSSGRHGCP